MGCILNETMAGESVAHKVISKANTMLLNMQYVKSANQWTGFYMITAAVMKELIMLAQCGILNFLKD